MEEEQPAAQHQPLRLRRRMRKHRTHQKDLLTLLKNTSKTVPLKALKKVGFWQLLASFGGEVGGAGSSSSNSSNNNSSNNNTSSSSSSSSSRAHAVATMRKKSALEQHQMGDPCVRQQRL
jgi:hypothetical protein